MRMQEPLGLNVAVRRRSRDQIFDGGVTRALTIVTGASALLRVHVLAFSLYYRTHFESVKKGFEDTKKI